MIKHLPVTSLESGRLAAASSAQSSMTRELGGALNESRKDRQRDKSEAAQQHALVSANLMLALSEMEDAKIFHSVTQTT